MRMLKAISFLCFSIPLHAVTSMQPVESFPELETISRQSSLKEIYQPAFDISLNKINHASVFYTYSQTGFEQQGSGQKYDTENGTGQGIYATFDRSLVSGNELNFKTWVNKAAFQEPSDIGGEDVSVQRLLFAGSYGWIWKSERSSWQLDAGITTLSQNPETFSTGEKLVPHYLALGPSLGAVYKFQISQNWLLRSGLMATLPALFKEYGSNSGYHELSWHYLGSVLLEAKLNKSLSFTLGVMAEGEEHSFSGSGERGIEDAKVSYLSFAVPMGVSYAF